ncbi:MAG: HAMP domain-containing protein, partial [Spirochaetaceae bacterium]|nr:HAMP domain-containing protein [Spirochaetaceae bacterium]
MGIDAQGRLSFLVKGEKRGNGFYNARLLGFDSLGRFYLDDTVMDIETTSTARRQVLLFSPSGRYLGAVAGFNYKGEAMNDWESHPIFGQIRGDDFLWFMKDAAGTWALITIPLVLETGARTTPLPGIDVYRYLDAAVLSEREVLFLQTDGRVARWTQELGLKEWFLNTAPGRTVLFPTCMAVDAEGRILIGDGKRDILRLDPQVTFPRAQSVLGRGDFALSGYAGRVAFQDVSASRPGEIVIGNEYTGELMRIGSDGQIESYADIPLSPRFAALRALAWICASAAALAALVAFVLVYARALRQRTPLVLRQLLVFIPLIGAMVAAVSVFVFQGLSSTLESQVKDRLVHLAQLGAAKTSAADMDALGFGSTGYADLLASERFQAVAKVVDELVNLNEDPWNASIYPYIYKKDGDAWWVFGSFEYVELYPYSKPEFELAAAKGERAFLRYSDVYGEWLSALEPILRADGSTAGLFEASMSADVLDEAGRGYAKRAAVGGAAILAVFVVAFSIFTAILLRSVRELRAGAERVSAGDYDSAVDIRSRDEIEELGDAFNTMTGEIKGYVDRLA